MKTAAAMIFLVLVLMVVLGSPASAYTDPGSGALIWQLLVAGFIGSMFYIRRFIAFLKRKKKDSD